MNRLMTMAATGEALTGAALALAPSAVCQMLFGADAPGMTGTVARVAGIAILSLGVACWPGRSATGPTIVGMLVYSAVVGAYLAYVGVRAASVGPLLWPAVAVHAILALLLVRWWLTSRYPHAVSATLPPGE